MTMPAADWRGRGVSLFCADALELLPKLPAGAVHAVVTDPPYNVGFAYANDASNDRKADYANWCAMVYSELRRATVGPIAVSVGTVNVGIWSSLRPDWWLAWHKPACMGRSTVGFNNWEPVALFGKSRGRAGTDVITAPIIPDNDVDGHPCPKPLRWAVGQIELLTRPGDIVLDSFMGSGTVGVAAIRLGRQFVGIEIEADYFNLAVRRIEKELSKPDLYRDTARPSETTTLFAPESAP